MSAPNDTRPQGTRRKFAAMIAAYLAGNLNDNFFKQSASILAVISGKAYLQGYAAIIFTIPFILFAAHAGFCADRFPKRSIVIGCKILELVAMLFAAFAIYSLNWSLMLLALFIMGFQATLFGPSLNGSIPELYPPQYVPSANAIIKATTTTAILAGIASAGFVLNMKGNLGLIPLGRVVVASLMIVTALAGLAAAFAVPKFPAADPAARFPWSGPAESVRMLGRLRKDSQLVVAIVCFAFFWFVGSLQVLIINQLGLAQLGLSTALTSTLGVVELSGIAAGSILSAILSKGRKWSSLLLPAAVVMTAAMFLVAFAPSLSNALLKPVLISALAVLGTAGGLFFIPLASFIQVRPASGVKGRVIAAANFAGDCGILISGTVLYLFNRLSLKPSDCFGLMGIMGTIMAVWLIFVLPRESDNA
jgi:acyl-[acyl-carrier-protein]-phospholipid O-acyltransferase / long-chain-fatty-acid--[acyl-carrier-protein] ligase